MSTYQERRNLDEAWAAGFFDARGVINEVRHGRNKSTLQLAINRSGDLEALERFLHIVSYGKIYDYPAKTANHRKLWSYRVNGEDARMAFQLIEPFLVKTTKIRYSQIEPNCA